MARITSQTTISTTAADPTELYYGGGTVRAIGLANTDTSTASVVKVSVQKNTVKAVSNTHTIWSVEVPAKSSSLFELNNSTISLDPDQKLLAIASGVTCTIFLIVDD